MIVLRNYGRFWAAAKTGTAEEFNAVLAEIKGHKEHGPAAYEYLMTHVNPKKWAKAFFMFFSKCDAVENNMCETFNGCILESRGKLLIYMLEEIRVYIIERMQRQRDLVQKWIDQELVLCPRIKKKLDIHIENSKYYHALFLGDLKFEVKHLNGSEGFVVDLRGKTCSCRRWGLSGLPCSHAVTCIFKKKDDVLDYIVEWYKVDKMKQAYDFYIKPLNGEKMWPKTNIDPPQPPQARRMPGRPKKQRRTEQHEEPQKRRFSISRAGLVIKCSRCKELGHNKSICKKSEAVSAGTTPPTTTNQKRQKMSKSNQVEGITTLPPATGSTRPPPTRSARQMRGNSFIQPRSNAPSPPRSNAPPPLRSNVPPPRSNATLFKKIGKAPVGLGVCNLPTGDTYIKMSTKKNGRWLGNNGGDVNTRRTTRSTDFVYASQITSTSSSAPPTNESQSTQASTSAGGIGLRTRSATAGIATTGSVIAENGLI